MVPPLSSPPVAEVAADQINALTPARYKRHAHQCVAL